MIYLAKQAEQKRVTISTLSKTLDASAKYLEKIMRDLSKARIIQSQRGPNGGYWLIHDLSNVSLGRIIRAVENTDELSFLASWFDNGERPKELPEVCITDRIFSILNERLVQELDQTSALGAIENAASSRW